MVSVTKRKVYLHINQFQKPIVNLTVAATFITVVILALCIYFLSYDLADLMLDPNERVTTSRYVIPLMLMILPLTYLVIIYLSLKVSNRMVGAFDRILRELDGVLAKNEKKHIRVRKDDQLVRDLLERINMLIDRMA